MKETRISSPRRVLGDAGAQGLLTQGGTPLAFPGPVGSSGIHEGACPAQNAPSPTQWRGRAGFSPVSEMPRPHILLFGEQLNEGLGRVKRTASKELIPENSCSR